MAHFLIGTIPLAGHINPALSTAQQLLNDGSVTDFHSVENLRILVVDDDDDNRVLIASILEAYGINAVTAASAIEALEVIQQFELSLLIIDISMPQVDGYSLIRTIRNLNSVQRNIPAIALTAVAIEEGRELALNMGFQAYLIKPIEPDNLVIQISKLIR